VRKESRREKDEKHKEIRKKGKAERMKDEE